MSDTERRLRAKISDSKKADEIIEDVKNYPDFHLMEGGSDGTFRHVLWHADYGHLRPEITDFAIECGGRV